MTIATTSMSTAVGATGMETFTGREREVVVLVAHASRRRGEDA